MRTMPTSHIGKVKMLIGVTVMLLLLTFQWLLFPALSLWTEVKQMEENRESLVSSASGSSTFTTTAPIMYADGTASLRETLAKFIAVQGDKLGCTVISIPPGRQARFTDFVVSTDEYVLQGSFHSLLSLLYQVEVGYSEGCNISSVHFFKKRNHRERRSYLCMSMVLQSIHNR